METRPIAAVRRTLSLRVPVRHPSGTPIFLSIGRDATDLDSCGVGGRMADLSNAFAACDGASGPGIEALPARPPPIRAPAVWPDQASLLSSSVGWPGVLQPPAPSDPGDSLPSPDAIKRALSGLRSIWGDATLASIA